MEILTVLALILIGIAIGFILTKGYQLEKKIREERKEIKRKNKENGQNNIRKD